MKKIFLNLFILLSSIFVFSQEKLFEFENTLKTNNTFLNQMFSIVNEKNGNISLFFIDNQHINCYLINDTYEVIDSLKLNNRNSLINVYLGYSISDDNNYCIYVTNSNQSKFASIRFSFVNKEVSYNEFKFKDRKKEKFIQAINYKHKFYILTSTKKTSIINKYSFDQNSNFIKYKIDFSENTFRNEYRSKKTLYSFFNNSSYGDVKTISPNTPNPIDITSAFQKLYVIDGKIIISLDQNKTYTQIISFNLANSEKEVKYIKKPLLSDTEFVSAKSNSYIYDDKIFILAISDEKLNLSIKDYQSSNLLKAYSFSEEDTITIKNTSLIKFTNNRTINKNTNETKDILRKISQSKVGISAYRFANDYQVTIGGKSHSNDGSIIVSGLFFGFSGALLTNILNATFKADALYFKGVLDSNFNHLNKDAKLNVIDKIINLKTKNKIGITKSETVYQYKNSFNYVYYNNKSKIIRIWKFVD